MKSLILLTLCALVAAEMYVDKEYLIGLKPGTDLQTFRTKLGSIVVKKSWDLGMTVLVHVYGEHNDVQSLNTLPEVKYIERNGIASIDQCSSQNANGCWGLDRTDQAGPLGYNDPEDASAVYNWGESTGLGVNAYILDTGIFTAHSDFGGRAVWGYTADGITSGDDDGNGHGTHCAGTIGSDSYGMAKEADLNAVKVLEDSGSGPWTAVIDGMDWVVGQNNGGRAVVSMSLGGTGITQSVLDAVTRLYDDGVVVVVSAGNSNLNACFYTPAAAPEALTIGASDITDTSADFTNWGTCVDLFAPGVDVKSTWNNGGTNTISGTSMSGPHVAGVVARYQSSQGTVPTPDNVNNFITTTATADALSWSGGNHDQSPNLLLFADCVI